MATATDPTGQGRKARTITAADPITGTTFSRRTARAYVACVVWTGRNGETLAGSWAGSPDLAAAALVKARKVNPSARLAPVVSDPWTAPEPEAAPAAEPLPQIAPAAPAAAAADQAAAAADQARADWLAGCADPDHPASQYLADLEARKARRRVMAAARRPVMPGEALPPEPPAWGGTGPELPPLPSRFRAWPPAGLEPWGNVATV